MNFDTRAFYILCFPFVVYLSYNIYSYIKSKSKTSGEIKMKYKTLEEIDEGYKWALRLLYETKLNFDHQYPELKENNKKWFRNKEFELYVWRNSKQIELCFDFLDNNSHNRGIKNLKKESSE